MLIRLLVLTAAFAVVIMRVNCGHWWLPFPHSWHMLPAYLVAIWLPALAAACLSDFLFRRAPRRRLSSTR